MRSLVAITICFLLVVYSGCGSSKSAQTADQKPPDKSETIKPYKDIITKDAKSDTGAFIVHRIKQKFYYEIPKNELDKDFLLISTQAKTQAGVGYGGDYLNTQVVRWSRENDKILLRSISYTAVAGDSLPIKYSVQKATFPPILAAFDLQAYGKDSNSLVIEVSDFYLSDMTETGPDRSTREQLKIRRLDPKRSYIQKIKAYPTNIEADVVLTYEAGQVPQDNALSTISMLVHQSMVRLPDRPMMARLADDRVGYFEVNQYDYGFNSQRAELRRYISRWRLEPKDPAAFGKGEPVEPVKPIVFYIDRGVPDKWRPWLHKGVEAWQSAFEKAGFKNAIIAKDPPSEKEDSNWSSEDARYSVVRWLPSEIENAYGPSITDPRTGEILDADIGFFHNVMNLLRDWYFVQVACLDPRVAQLPIPDSLMGELLQYVTTHEVGHSIGFQHNMKASSSYPVDSLRSASFTQRYGNEPSIMDYGRFNYVAQPGDNARLIPIVGPYDDFAVEWGYKPVTGANSPDDEKAQLNKIAARQETEPFLRFGSSNGIDPSAQTEDLGNDAVASTKYGLMNINRIAKMLLTATTKDGEDYDNLQEMYLNVIGQRNRELGHVANVVGGVNQSRRVAGQAGVVHTHVSSQKQREAVDYLLKEAFRTPTELLSPDLLALFEPTGAQERVQQGHRQVLNTLFNNGRLERIANHEANAKKGEQVLPLKEIFSTLRKGIWSELRSSAPASDVYRRNLQRAYIDVLGTKLNPPPFSPPSGLPPGFQIAPPAPLPGEARALIRKGLIDLDAEIAAALPHVGDEQMRAHLLDSRYQISKILYPEKRG